MSERAVERADTEWREELTPEQYDVLRRAGTEPAFKAVVDAEQDGKSLADTQQWHDSVGDRATGKVGLGYLDVKALLTLLDDVLT